MMMVMRFVRMMTVVMMMIPAVMMALLMQIVVMLVAVATMDDGDYDGVGAGGNDHHDDEYDVDDYE